MATPRKSFKDNEEEVSLMNTVYSNEDIERIIAENERFKKQKTHGLSEEDKVGKELWGYVIALSSANQKYPQNKVIDFGHNGIIYPVNFGIPAEVPCSVVEMLELHIKENTRTDGGKINTTNIHYTFSKIREVWR